MEAMARMCVPSKKQIKGGIYYGKISAKNKIWPQGLEVVGSDMCSSYAGISSNDGSGSG
jgi:hypothetical protein